MQFVLANPISRLIAAAFLLLFGLAAIAYVLVALLHGVWMPRAALTQSGPSFFEVLQASALVVAIIVFLWTRQHDATTLYTEVNKRYEQLSRTILEKGDLPTGFSESDLAVYQNAGGAARELVFYDIVFSVCEHAYRLYSAQPAELDRWERWLSNFFDTNTRCVVAWCITSQYYEQPFRSHINKTLVDSRIERAFPSREAWRDASEDNETLQVTPDGLRIFGFHVMEEWEKPYMDRMAASLYPNGKAVLEVGYGLGLATEALQRHIPASHTIIEANSALCQRAMQRWQREIERGAIEIVPRFWEDCTSQPPWGDKKFDAILFDTFPLTRYELRRNHCSFFKWASKWLADGGRFSFFSDASTVIPEFVQIDIRQHFPTATIEVTPCAVRPRPGCEYWKSDTILNIVVMKP